MFFDNFITNNIYKRSLIILPCFENKTFLVHNGKFFLSLKVTKEMIGKKLGEFVFTKKKPVFKIKKKNKKK